MARQQSQSLTNTKLFTHGQTVTASIPAYQDYLVQKQEFVADEAKNIGLNVQIRKNYVNAVNGFSVEMTPSDAKKLSELGQIKYVARSVPEGAAPAHSSRRTRGPQQ